MMAKAFITGLEGTGLTERERSFLADERPWGLILFQRNCVEPAQVRDLVAGFRDAVGRADAPVLIDQEGGRVQRLKPPHWPAYPPGASFGALYLQDADLGLQITRLNARLIAADLQDLGIDVDCLPVLDVPQPGSHDVIGDRAYGATPEIVIALAREAAEGLLAGGVLPVIKHIPGHGRAGVDSHKLLPRVDASREALEMVDFAPFRALHAMPLAMTAHVVYEALDDNAPATTSRRVLEGVIRGNLGFKGCLMSDDLSMEALDGDFGARTRASLSAGCDLVLHCNGDFAEMRAVADATPPLGGKALERADAALARRGVPEPFDRAEARARLEDALAEHWRIA